MEKAKNTQWKGGKKRPFPYWEVAIVDPRLVADGAEASVRLRLATSNVNVETLV